MFDSVKKRLSCNYSYIIIVLYAIALFSLNAIRIFDNNFWGDEAFTIRLAQTDFWSMIKLTAEDVHPPLYYLIVQIMCKIFGYRGEIYHLSALIPYMIILIIALIRIPKRFNIQTSIIFITFASLLSTAVNFNVEARMYTWGGLFVILSFLELYEILIDNQKRDYVFFILASLAAAYTHYYCLISVAFFYLVLIILACVKRNEYLKKVTIACILTIIGYLPWLFVLLETFDRVSEDYWMEDIPLFRYCVGYLFDSKFKYVFCVIMIISCMAIIVKEVYFIKRIETLNKKDSLNEHMVRIIWLSAAFISIFGTMAVGIGVSIVLRPVFIPRYLFPVAYVAWLICAFSVSEFKYKNILTALVIILIFIGCVPEYKDKLITEKTQNDILLETLEKTKEIDKKDIIFTNMDHINWTIADYYYPNVVHYYVNTSKIHDLEKGVRYWLILSEEIGKEIKESFIKSGYTVQEIIKEGILGTHKVFIYCLDG